MATLTASVHEYCSLLARSKLLSTEEVDTLARRWTDDVRGGDDQVEGFTKFLVKERILTAYQAVMIQRGHPEGFFLNGYKILDRIGKGQMGGVYKAAHTLGQTVALKILASSKAKDPHTLGRFQREARLLTQLDHPNVVRAFQVGEAGGVHYIVMEYLEGETLDEVLSRRKRLPVGEAVRLVRQALAGLQHLHERRMVHRDLKPSNMMLTPAADKPDTTWDATIKILDIGLGRELFDDGTPEGRIETQLTEEGAVLGTPDYLAPEQARDARTSDIRADLYSLGCVLYHCLTGRPPFPDTNIMSQMLKHATEKPAPLYDFLPDVPGGLQNVLDTFLAKDPDHRYQTPGEGADALGPFLAPGAGAAPAGANMVPAYRQWLATESQMEMPRNLPAAPKPGTGPAAPLPASTGRDASGKEARRVEPPRPGSAPAPALAVVKPGGGTAVHPAAAPVKTSAPPRLARPAPAPAPLPLDDEVDVELVTIPAPPAVVALPLPLPDSEPGPVAEEPGLLPKNRRDLIMLAIGGFGTLVAVVLGYLLAQAAK
jgi:serine/threonine protein kinase